MSNYTNCPICGREVDGKKDNITYRRHRFHHTECLYGQGPSDQQQQLIDRLRKDILDHDSHRTSAAQQSKPNEYEYKRFDVHFWKETGHVCIQTEVGLKGDEETMAGVFCRTRRMIQIGRRGGIKSLIGKKVSGYRNVMIWGAES